MWIVTKVWHVEADSAVDAIGRSKTQLHDAVNARPAPSPGKITVISEKWGETTLCENARVEYHDGTPVIITCGRCTPCKV